MKLSDYLEREGKTTADGARELGYCHDTFRKWVKGLRRPRRSEDLQKIEQWSGGEVTARDFYAVETEAA